MAEVGPTTAEKIIPFEKKYRMPRMHHPALAVIHPQHKYTDPRKEKVTVKPDIKPEAKKLEIKTRPASASQKKNIPTHLSQPFVYIKKVSGKEAREKNYSSHPDLWNKSTNVTSKRQQRTFTKHEITEETISNFMQNSPVKDSGPGKSKKTVNAREERALLYQENLNTKEKIFAFFEEVRNCLKERKYDNIIRNKAEKIPLRKLFAMFCKIKKLEEKVLGENLDVNLAVFSEFMRDIGLQNLENIKKFFQICKIEAPIHEKLMETKKKQLKHEAEEQEKRERIDNVLTYENIQRRMEEREKKILSIGNEEKLSMRAFFYNYERYFRNKQRIKHLTSMKAAKQRNGQLFEYLEDWKVAYEDEKYNCKIQRELEDRALEIIFLCKEEERAAKARAEQNKDPRLKTRVIRENNYLSEAKNQSPDYGQIFRGVDENKLEETLISFIETKDYIFKQKRATAKFLIPLITSDYISFDSLSSSLNTYQEKEQAVLKQLGDFVHEFRTEKNYFKESVFSFVELANFFYEHKYKKSDLENIAPFLSKVKKYYNIKTKAMKSTNIDPNEMIPVDEVALTFQIQCRKAQFKNEILTDLIKQMMALIDANFRKFRPENPIIQKTVEYNLIAEYLNQFFENMRRNQDRLGFFVEAVVSDIINKLSDYRDSNGMQTIRSVISFHLRREGMSEAEKFDNYPSQSAVFESDIHRSQEELHPADNRGRTTAGPGPNFPYALYEQKKNILTDVISKHKEAAEVSRQPVANIKSAQDINLNEEDDIIGLLNTKKLASSSKPKDFEKKTDFLTPGVPGGYKPEIKVIRAPDEEQNVRDFRKMPLNTLDPRKAGANNEQDEEDVLDFFNRRSASSPRYNEVANNVDINRMPLTVSQAMSSDGFYKSNREKGYENKNELPKVEEDLTLEEIFEKTNKLRNKRKVEEPSPASELGNRDLRLSNLLMKSKAKEDFLKLKEEYVNPKGSAVRFDDLRSSINQNYYKPDGIDLGKDKLKSNKFTDYEVYLPVEYYNMMTAKEAPNPNHEWFLRSHHLETLTENPLSHKDNILDTNYKSHYRMDEDEEKEIKPRDEKGRDREALIDNLNHAILKLRNEVEYTKAKNLAKAGPGIHSTSSPFDPGVQAVNKYFDRMKTENEKESQLAASESLLFELRKREKELLNSKRDVVNNLYGKPKENWWEERGPEFITEYKKHNALEFTNPKSQRNFVEKLQVKELY